MKNKTYIFGLICILLIVAGCIAKIQHWPGGGISLTLGFSLFTLVFMPTALINSFRTETDKKLRTLYIIAYICILIDCTGVLFKVQHWPGTNILMIISIPLPFVLFLPVYLLSIRKNKQLNYNNLLLVLFFFAYFASISALLAINVSKGILDEYVDSANNYEEQAKLSKLQTEILIGNLPASNSKDSIRRETLLKIKAASSSLYKLIDNMKIGIVRGAGDNSQLAIDTEGNVDLSKICNLDNKNIYNNEIFIKKSNELKKEMTAYRNFLMASLNPKEVEVATYIRNLLDTPNDWKSAEFDDKIMIAIMDALSSIKNKVALAELETITAIDNSNL